MSSYDAKYFIGLIAHEHTHVMQYQQFGYFGFVAKYGIEVSQKGYRNAPMEVRAYNIGDAMDTWLTGNPDIVKLIDTDRTGMNSAQTKELDSQLLTAGKRFRAEAGIDAEIKFWSDASVDLLGLIEQNGGTLNDAPKPLVELYDMYRKEITDLQMEKETLNEELNGQD